MGNSIDDILANSSAQRINDMINPLQKAMDRIDGVQFRKYAFPYESMAEKMIERLKPVWPSLYKSESLVETFTRGFDLNKKAFAPFLEQTVEGMSPMFNVFGAQADSIANSMSQIFAPMSSFTWPQFESPYKSLVDSMTSIWPKMDTFVPAKIALESYRPTKKQLEQKALAEVIEKAEQFHREFTPEAAEHLEAQAEDFVSQDADAAYLLARSPVLANLSLYQREMISRFLMVVIYVAFVGAAIYGAQTGSANWAIAVIIFGFPSAPAAAKFTYRKSMYVLEKFASDEE